jgi:tyrosine-protein phosphatase non-receptor type 23
VKAKYFASLAQFNRAVADAASSKYGDSLTRFVLAESLAKEASKLATTFSKEFTPLTASASFLPDAPVSLVDLTKNHLTICSETRAKAQRDNDLIYNAVLPSEAALPVIEKSSVAAPIPIQDVYASPEVQKIIGPDLFTKLIPLAVHENASLYSEEKAKVVRAEAERVDLAEGERIALLEYLGLPASLERFSSAGSNGQDNLADPGGVVRNWSDELRRYEASGRVEEMIRTIKSLKDGVTKELDTAGRELEMESRECESMRSRFGHLWEQAPSSSLTRAFRQDMKSHKDSLDQASQSDRQVEALWQGIKNDVVILMDNDRVEQAFTVAVGSSVEGSSQNLLDDDFNEDDKQDEDMSKRVGVIKEALSRLNKIKKERTDVFKDLKEKVCSFVRLWVFNI